VDVKTQRMDRYGEGAGAEGAVVLFDGIHYDAVALAAAEGAPREFDQTVFPAGPELEAACAGAAGLARALSRDGQYTDTAAFALSCGDCGAALRGEAEAVAHARLTGHAGFTGPRGGGGR